MPLAELAAVMVKAFPLAASLLSLVLVERAFAADNDAAHRPRVQMVATADFVAVATAAEVQVHDGAGRWLFRLPVADDGDGDGAASRGERALARERAFDALGVPEEAHDDQEVLDLVEEELPGRGPRERSVGGTGSEARPAILLASNGHALVLGTASALWRLEPGQSPQRLGPAPAGATALGVDGSGRLFAARPGEVLAADADATGFRVIHRPAFSVRQLVVDPGGAFLGLRGPDQIERVPLVRGAGPASVRAVGRPRDLAVCGGRLFALTDAGVGAAAGDDTGTLALVTRPTDAAALACNPWGTGPLLLYGPGLLVASPGTGTATPTATAAVTWPVPTSAAVTGAAVTGDHVWVYGRGFGLAQLRADPAGRGPPALVVVDPGRDAEAMAAGDEVPALALRPNRLLPPLLPYVSLTLRGRESLNPGRHDLALGLAAEWRLPPAGVPVVRRVAGGPLPLALASLEAAQAPGGEAPPGAASAAFGGPAFPAPDLDTACLERTRARAVALALVEPERARSLVSRAANAAWLPELRVRAERRVGRSESLDYKPTAASDALGLDSVDDVRYEVRATWDLPRLVFSPEELGAAQQASRIAEMRREIEAQVNRLYFERRRLLAAPAGQTPREDLSTWQIRIEEIEADLDTLSAGGFTRCRQTPAPAAAGDSP
jgi:hypothetical protein